MLSEEAISEFKDLYKKECGIELTNEEASRCAHWLIGMYKAVLKEDDGKS